MFLLSSPPSEELLNQQIEALAAAVAKLTAEEEVRVLIHDLATRKIDLDYDILLPWIEHKSLNDGQSVKDALIEQIHLSQDVPIEQAKSLYESLRLNAPKLHIAARVNVDDWDPVSMIPLVASERINRDYEDSIVKTMFWDANFLGNSPFSEPELRTFSSK